MITKNFVLPANSSGVFGLVGSFLRINSATGPVGVRIGERNAMTLREGNAVRIDGGFGPAGRELVLVNSTALDIDLTLVCGDGNFTANDAAELATSPHVLVDTADQTVGAAATVLIAPVNGDREEVIIQADADVRIGTTDVGAARGLLLAADQTLVLSVRAAIYCYNPGGTAATLRVLETEVQL